MRDHRTIILIIAAAALSACSEAKSNAATALEEARVGVAASRSWGAEEFAPELQAAAERELATAEKSFMEGRYAQVGYPAQRAIEAARLARAQAGKLPKHSPRRENTSKTTKAKVKK